MRTKMGPQAGLWDNWEVAGCAGARSNRRELKVGRPYGPRERSRVDSGIPSLVCHSEPKCALNLEPQVPRLKREGHSSASQPLAVYHVFLISHSDIAQFRWGNQGTKRGSGHGGHTRLTTGFQPCPHPVRGQEATWNCLDNEAMVTSFPSRSSLDVTQRAG